MVYVHSMGVAVFGIVVVSWAVVIVFLGPWLSASNMKVLSFGRDAAAFIVLAVLPLNTSIHSPSYCSLLFPCPPHRQLLLSSFLSSFAALWPFVFLSLSELICFHIFESHLFAHACILEAYCLIVPHALIRQESLRVLRFSVLLTMFARRQHFHCFLLGFALFFAR